MTDSPLDLLIRFPQDTWRVALAWAQRTGWPQRDADLALAAMLWEEILGRNPPSPARIRRLTKALAAALPDTVGDASHRRVLIRLTWRAARGPRR